jgi:hypothetical protein
MLFYADFGICRASVSNSACVSIPVATQNITAHSVCKKVLNVYYISESRSWINTQIQNFPLVYLNQLTQDISTTTIEEMTFDFHSCLTIPYHTHSKLWKFLKIWETSKIIYHQVEHILSYLWLNFFSAVSYVPRICWIWTGSILRRFLVINLPQFSG